MLSRLRHSRFYRRISGLVLLAMLVPTFAMLVQPVMAAMPMDGMHHCGMAAKAPADDSKSPAHKSSCPICQTMHMLGGGLHTARPISLGNIIRTGLVIRQAGHDAVTMHHWLSPHIQPRAPPLSA